MYMYPKKLVPCRCSEPEHGETTRESTHRLSKTLLGAGLAISLGFAMADGNQALAQNCVQPPPGLIGWWDADAVSGTTAVDIEGGNDGTMLSGVGIVPGVVGDAFSFNGSSYQRIQLPFDSGDVFTDRFTVDAWARPEKITNFSYFQAIIENDDIATGAGRGMGLGFMGGIPYSSGGIYYPNPFRAMAFFHDPSGTSGGQFVVLANTNPNEMHHYASTYDGSELCLYIDGVQKACIPANGVLNDNNKKFLIAGDTEHHTSNRYFEGEIDEVEIFDRALTPSEVRAIYSAGAAGKCKFRVHIAKTLLHGPRVDVAGSLVDVEGLVRGISDAGPIDVARPDSQFYGFAIEITNDGADGEFDGMVVSDPVPDTYDLDPLCGEDPGLVTSCDAVGGGTFVDSDSDNYADGIINDTPAKCIVSTSSSDSSIKKGGEGLEPEIITIELTPGLNNGEHCRVRVFVKTDQKPSKKGSSFEPTGCREIDGGIYDTVLLNEGVKLFDPGTGDRLLGPVGSLQLTPNNCP